MHSHARSLDGNWQIHLKPDIHLKRFNMAAKEAAEMRVDFTKLIHHSDRGVQYCCNLYVNRLLALGIQISMTENYKPTDNAKAERVNGIIKQLFIDNQVFTEISEVYFTLSRGIPFYNDVRPHSSISHQPPSKVHRGEVADVRQMWQNRGYSKYAQS